MLEKENAMIISLCLRVAAIELFPLCIFEIEVGPEQKR